MKYRYTGPMSGVTLKTGGAQRDVLLIPGQDADLPESHEYTRTLLALGHLAPAPVAPTKTKAKGA